MPILDLLREIRTCRARYGLESPEGFSGALGPWQQLWSLGAQLSPMPGWLCPRTWAHCLASMLWVRRIRRPLLRQGSRLFARVRPRQTAAFKAADTSGVVEELVLLFEEAGAFRPKHAREPQLQE